MIYNRDNLIITMGISALVGTLKFDDVSNSVINEELQSKSIVKNQGGEALALDNHGRKIECSK